MPAAHFQPIISLHDDGRITADWFHSLISDNDELTEEENETMAELMDDLLHQIRDQIENFDTVDSTLIEGFFQLPGRGADDE